MTTPFSNERPLDDPSYEPGRLYRVFGKPNLASWMLYVAGAVAVCSLIAAGVGTLVA